MGVLISSRRGTFPAVEINGLKARGAFVPDEGDLTVDCRAGSNLSRPRISEKETLGEAKDQESEEIVTIVEFVKAVVLLASSQDCTPSFGKGGLSTCVISIPRDNLIDSWYQSRSFMHVVGVKNARREDRSPPATSAMRGHVAPGDRLMPSQVTPSNQRDARTGHPRQPGHAFAGHPVAASLERARLAVSVPVHSLPTLLASNPIGFTDKIDDKGSSEEPVLTGYEQRKQPNRMIVVLAIRVTQTAQKLFG
ncbi:hypothetical protein F2Q68_00043111 [Brassica cretica]|uniref:Uncharacterized protein n=1 Tax=Brassica cretica TaxID=69181 RepID=A0A8S9LJM7_BRACR|nr:hypothetical protein F2Q68_00043111 [Brassica cretica]